MSSPLLPVLPLLSLLLLDGSLDKLKQVLLFLVEAF
jgi:hypothetical protein